MHQPVRVGVVLEAPANVDVAKLLADGVRVGTRPAVGRDADAGISRVACVSQARRPRRLAIDICAEEEDGNGNECEKRFVINARTQRSAMVG